jgi:hypothetical protein
VVTDAEELAESACKDVYTCRAKRNVGRLWFVDTVATYPVLRAVRPAVASVPILASIQGVPESVDSHA